MSICFLAIAERLADHFKVNVVIYTLKDNYSKIVHRYPFPFKVERPFICLLQSLVVDPISMTQNEGNIKGHIDVIRRPLSFIKEYG